MNRLVFGLMLGILGGVAACGNATDVWNHRSRSESHLEKPTNLTTATPPREANPQASLSLGTLEGRRENGAEVFYGIPFAEAPVRKLRFAPPKPWSKVYGKGLGQNPGPKCPQGDPVEGKEDCLYLNVWRPKLDNVRLAQPLPVMVFIHGGALETGDSLLPSIFGNFYDGGGLAQRGPAVVVTIQYRLGALGWAADPALRQVAGKSSGNLGLLDQIEALRWVSQNISAFAGDPSNVTVFGESAGAMSVCALLTTPKASSLFHRAIKESGACQTRALAEQEHAGRALFTQLGCNNSDAAKQVACLESLSAEKIVKAQPKLQLKDMETLGKLMNFLPVVDGITLSQSPLTAIDSGAWNQVPLIDGSNINEIPSFIFPFLSQTEMTERVRKAFQDDAKAKLAIAEYQRLGYKTPAQIFAAMNTDVTFTCPKYELARKLSNLGHPVWTYRFDYRNAVHGVELASVFAKAGDKDPVANLIGSYWTSFAASGAPSAAGPQWPVFDESRSELRFNTESRAVAFDRTKACDLILGSKARMQ